MQDERDAAQDEETEVEAHERAKTPEEPGARVGHTEQKEDEEVEAHFRAKQAPEGPDARVG